MAGYETPSTRTRVCYSGLLRELPLLVLTNMLMLKGLKWTTLDTTRPDPTDDDSFNPFEARVELGWVGFVRVRLRLRLTVSPYQKQEDPSGMHHLTTFRTIFRTIFRTTFRTTHLSRRLSEPAVAVAAAVAAGSKTSSSNAYLVIETRKSLFLRLRLPPQSWTGTQAIIVVKMPASASSASTEHVTDRNEAAVVRVLVRLSQSLFSPFLRLELHED